MAAIARTSEVPLFILDRFKRVALEVQEYGRLVGAAFHASFTRPMYRDDIVEQFDSIGVQSLTVVLLTAFFTGAVLALQSGLTLDQFGARPVVGRLVSATMIMNLGPVLTGLMLCGRVGSGIAAELGSMVVTDQVNDILLSVDAYYHPRSRPNAKKVDPFLDGGFSLGLEPLPGEVQQISFLSLGGGVTYWLNAQRGIRFELRDAVTLDEPQTGYHHLGFRVGYTWLLERK